tara:strand:- start:1638 stop:2555 length:918 start_codon:yes stop_codon:yes gene_type:complete
VGLKFKPKFVERYNKLTDFEEYEHSVKKYARKSIRVNTLLYSTREVKKSLKKDGWILNPLKWCKDGFYIEHESGRHDVGNTEQHEKGMFFSQGAPSMIPALLMNLKSKKGFRVLDMCASPGGKTHHISCLMKGKGVIVSNEFDRYRRKVLNINLKRCGVKNVKVSAFRGEKFELCEGIDKFDAILVDAPCTGSGMIKGDFARTKKLLKEWNPKMVKKYARLQKKLLERGFDLLKNGGRIVYATCSLDPEEDEGVANWFKDNFKCKLIKPSLLNGEKIKSSSKDFIKIWPQYYNTEGFFVAVFEKC